MKKALQLEDLTPEQYAIFKAHIYNGVGSRDFFINPADLIFKKAAEAHDLAYFVGGPNSLRKLADDRFLKEARQAVLRQPGWERVFYFPVAYMYYYFLVIGGSLAWEYYDEPASTWEELLEHVRAYYIRKTETIPDWLQ